MKEPEQSLERSKSADNVAGDKSRRQQEDFCNSSRSQTADTLWMSLHQSQSATSTNTNRSLASQHRSTSSSNNHSVEERYHLLTSGRGHPHPSHSKQDGSLIESSTMDESMEALSVGYSDNEAFEDDLSDTETDNEWEGCEVTHV